MSEAIAVSIISLVGTLLGTFGGIVVSNRLTVYRIEQLEKKVEALTVVTSRVCELEKYDAVKKEELKVINHRIADLEDFHKGGQNYGIS